MTGSAFASKIRGVEFGILGPLEARDGDRVVPLGGPRQRGVLAILLTRAGRVVPAEQLVDELWSSEPPASAAGVLQTYVSNLRKSLGRGAIVTRGPGYSVALEPGQLDLHEFERLTTMGAKALAEGSPGEAAAAFREALDLWRGPALADFAYEPFAQAEIARLEELRLLALERRIDADLACGRHAEVVGELEGLAAEHPLREHLHRQLMLALYRSGRQAEALEAYRAAREALVEGLGIEPGAALQELQRAILRQDPELQPTAATSAPRADRSIVVATADPSAIDRLLQVAEPLARRPPRELILACLLPESRVLGSATAELQARCELLAGRGLPARFAAFTSRVPGDDLVRLALEQDADLVLLEAPGALLSEGNFDADLAALLHHAPCDVAVVASRQVRSGLPVLIPFGGAEHDWSAVEVAAWLAGSLGSRLTLAGIEEDLAAGRRDASRLLARASLIVQQVIGITADPLLVPAGAEGILEASAEAGVLVLGLSPRWAAEGLGQVRHVVMRDAPVTALLVRRGLRPGGIAPPASETLFTWTVESGRAG